MPIRKAPFPNPTTCRRGGTYIVVIGSALIVSTFGMIALLQQRVQRKGFEAASRMEQARLNIESAMRLGLLDVERDPNWRNTYAASSGEILTVVSPEYGNVLLSASDPYDDDLADDPNDPVVFAATAGLGGATQLAERTLFPTAVPPDALWQGVVAADDISSTGGIVRSDRPISCDASTLASASMYADVEAVTLSGSSYLGSATLVDDADRPRVPDMNTLVNEYVSRGTAINFLSLPTSTANLVRNPGMESGQGDDLPADHWSAPPIPPDISTSTVLQENSKKQSGSFSVFIKNRSNGYAGPAQDCTEWVKPNATYLVEAWVYSTNVVPTLYEFSWYTKGTGSAKNYAVGGTTLVPGLLWTKITGAITIPAWSGDLELSYLKIQTQSLSVTNDFYVDDVSVKQINRSFLHRRVLSPSANPFGAPNAEGIYVIDCNNLPLVIERCRIRGTLVLLNPGAGSAIEGPMSWDPAKVGYPSLIVGSTGLFSANMKVAPSRRGLNETLNSTNYNPAGTPHEAVGTDADQNDILPSEIRGWMYVGDTLTFGNEATIHGVVMAGNDIIFGGKPTIHWDAAPIFNPPPGLEGTLELKTREGASKKAVQ